MHAHVLTQVLYSLLQKLPSVSLSHRACTCQQVSMGTPWWTAAVGPAVSGPIGVPEVSADAIPSEFGSAGIPRSMAGTTRTPKGTSILTGAFSIIGKYFKRYTGMSPKQYRENG